MRNTRKSALDPLQVFQNAGAAIDVNGRTKAPGQRGKRNILAAEFGGVITKGLHVCGRISTSRAALWPRGWSADMGGAQQGASCGPPPRQALGLRTLETDAAPPVSPHLSRSDQDEGLIVPPGAPVLIDSKLGKYAIHNLCRRLLGMLAQQILQPPHAKLLVLGIRSFNHAIREHGEQVALFQVE